MAQQLYDHDGNPVRGGGSNALATVAIVLMTVAVIATALATVLGIRPGQLGARQQATADTRGLNATAGAGTTSDTPALNLEQINATSTTIYHATAEAVALPIPNVGQSAPVTTGQRVSERQPAPAVVPTAEPVVQGESGGIFGSKPAVVNPQETHECKHAQVWTDSGCKNPTPVK